MQRRRTLLSAPALRSARPRRSLLPTLLPLLVLALVFGCRALLVDTVAGSYTDCPGCYLLPTLGSDAWLFAAALVLLAIGAASRRPRVGVVARVLVGLLAIVAALDVVLLDMLAQRLHLDDVARFGGAVGNNWSVVSAALGSPSGMLKAGIAGVGLILVLASWRAAAPRPRLAAALGVGALCVLGFALLARTQPLRYVHAAYAENVVGINLPQGRTSTYGDAHLAAARARVDALPVTCERPPSTHAPDVIVLLVESLSAWHSRQFGGAHDWTPRLDAMARDNHYLSRFYANGFTTSGGEIALATGHVPFNPPGVLDFGFSHYADKANALPALGHATGHRVDFFTPGDSGFLDLGDWLRVLGFDGVHDSADAFYTEHRRWQFNAAEDRVFFARYLEWLDARPPDERFISLLLTVTTHPPFVEPEHGRTDPAAAFHYVDAQIGAFHDALRARGFFEHGVLIVLGDHRSMTPLSAPEYAAKGERAFAHVPLVVVGAVDMPKVVDAPFQQSDVLPSLAWLLGQPRCRNAFSGSFLRPDPHSARYVMHVRGDDRSRVDVYHGESEVAGFRLDGDDSHWIDGAPEGADDVAAWITAQRAAAAERGARMSTTGPRR